VLTGEAVVQAVEGARLGDVRVSGAGDTTAVQLVPRSVHDVARAVSLAHRSGLRVNVTQRVRPGLLALDLSSLSAIDAPDEVSGIVRVGAGCRVMEVEDRAARAGLTLGTLLPQTAFKKLGAWLAGPTRGERTEPGGRLETSVLALEAVLADGSVYRSVEAPRSATGPDLDHLLLGAEGRFGIITRATLRLQGRRLAEAFGVRAAATVDAAIETLREISTSAIAPAEARWSLARGTLEARFSGNSAAISARAFGSGPLAGHDVTSELELAGAWAQWSQVAALAPTELQFVAMHAGGAFGALRFADPASAPDAAARALALGFVIVSPRRLRPAPELGFREAGAAAIFTSFAAELDRHGTFARD